MEIGFLKINNGEMYNGHFLMEKGPFDEIQEKKYFKELNIQVGNLLILTRYLRLFKIEENEVIGLDDYVNKDNLYIFNAICKNNYELYSID